VDGEAVNACLMLAAEVNGKSVVTLEGITYDPRNLHPLQEAFINHFAVQCGFCTPGMIMAAKALIDRNPHPTDSEIVEALEGNLCRCTGYKQIIDAIRDVANRNLSR
jgi:carbon-monoxide dehydrogenase small subunit